ncbi:DoxX family protein [Poseidonibacter lekithochrous]|uniref:DoxX family protein n=1 Tax=Poseidonibacter lekithochrous TaxID=1904463 RepID=UPI0008FC57B4|nr:DoxX family protein [Poseidonibacter lekithochrous]QKJ22478.1 DoxX family protein [Poseidonibacter lekithochrous]
MKEKILNKKGFYFITTGIIAILVGLLGGVMDIVQPQGVIDTADALGYPLYFFALLGVFKILGAIALFLPKQYDRIRDVAYAGFAFDFVFASFSHYSVNDGIVKIIIPLVLLVVLSISFYLKDRLKKID